MSFKAAAIQINSGNDMIANLRNAGLLIKDAADAGASLVTLPENVAFMAEDADDLHANSYLMESHPAVEIFSDIAKQLNINVLVGSLAVKLSYSSKLANRSLFFDKDGKLSAFYDKIHMYDASPEGGESHRESEKFEAGKKAVLVPMDECHLGLTICYDVRFPYLYRHLAQKGANILAVPSAFTHYTGVPHWEILLRARAIENSAYVIAAAQVGEHPSQRQTYGHAMIIDPWGEVIADAGATNEGVAIAEIDIDKVNKIRNELPSLKNGVHLFG